MPLKIATWNVNSVRLRFDHIAQFLRQEQPDVLCLQETKCPDKKFPFQAFHDLGWSHVAAAGQKGYNGVAIAARVPLEDVRRRDFCGKGDARHISARLPNGARLHNFYVPAGGDVPDRTVNEKFGHKLDFMAELRAWMAGGADDPQAPTLVVGDLNIAPLETDVWSHTQMSKKVSHTPPEVETFAAAQASRDFVDVTRQITPPSEALFSWWSYRVRAWEPLSRGLRLDHIWATPDLAHRLVDSRIVAECRSWERPSDHAPVTAVFA